METKKEIRRQSPPQKKKARDCKRTSFIQTEDVQNTPTRPQQHQCGLIQLPAPYEK